MRNAIDKEPNFYLWLAEVFLLGRAAALEKIRKS